MKRYGRRATIGMPKLSMRASLSNLCEPQLTEKRHNLARFQNRRFRHGLRHLDRLSPDVLTLECRIAFLKQHLDYFLKVRS